MRSLAGVALCKERESSRIRGERGGHSNIL